MGRMIGVTILGLFGLFQIIAGQSVNRCMPDGVKSIGKTGHCVNTDKLEAECFGDQEIRVSMVDCAKFDGNWCCFARLSQSLPALNKTAVSLALNITSMNQMMSPGPLGQNLTLDLTIANKISGNGSVINKTIGARAVEFVPIFAENGGGFSLEAQISQFIFNQQARVNGFAKDEPTRTIDELNTDSSGLNAQISEFLFNQQAQIQPVQEESLGQMGVDGQRPPEK